eukprot:c18742_g1_i1 orf=358-1419(+)
MRRILAVQNSGLQMIWKAHPECRLTASMGISVPLDGLSSSLQRNSCGACRSELFRSATKFPKKQFFLTSPSENQGPFCCFYSQIHDCSTEGQKRELFAASELNLTKREVLEAESISSFHGGLWVPNRLKGGVSEEYEEQSPHPVGGIHLIVGPMFAGKTTALLKRMQAEVQAGRRIALVKSDKDTRYGLDAIVSHAGMKMPCLAVPTLSAFRQRIGEEDYGKLDVIGIDEAQFFKDIYTFCQVAADQEAKTLIVAGLDGDFLRKSFGSTLELIPLADSIVKLSSRCELCGRPAAFTFRKTDDAKRDVIGGTDVYMAVCRRHYLSGQFTIETTRTVLDVHQADDEMSAAEAAAQ